MHKQSTLLPTLPIEILFLLLWTQELTEIQNSADVRFIILADAHERLDVDVSPDYFRRWTNGAHCRKLFCLLSNLDGQPLNRKPKKIKIKGNNFPSSLMPYRNK